MSTCIFRSCLAPRLQAFFETRVALGRKGSADRKILIYLDRFFMEELKPGQPITSETVQRWFKRIEHLSSGTRINRLSLLRQFCVYLSHFDPRTCVIHRSWIPSRKRLSPHIYSAQEVRSIMEAASQIGPPDSLRPAVISTIVGLLYCTGLRIGEALKLTLADLDLKNHLLTVRESKFKKSRHVPISPSTSSHLADFLRQREKAGFPNTPQSSVFIGPAGRAYGPARVCEILLMILRNIGLRGPRGERGPRLHDLRHSFAVTRLAQWYQQGGNLNAKLPLLATYLGHTSTTGTEIYLQATAELLEKTSRRFHNRFAIPHLKQPKPKEVPHAKKL